MPDTNAFIRMEDLKLYGQWENKICCWNFVSLPDVFPFTPNTVRELARAGVHPANLLLSPVMGRPITGEEWVLYVEDYRARVRSYKRASPDQRREFAAKAVINTMWPQPTQIWQRAR